MVSEGKQIIRTRWIDTWKSNTDGTRKIKSRLVVKGCEESASCPTTFAPTASKEVIVLALNVMANKHWVP